MEFDLSRPSVTHHHPHAGHEAPHVTTQVLDAVERADKPASVDMRPKLPEGASWNPDGTVTITLDAPVTINHVSDGHAEPVVTHELKCRRLLGGDMIDASDSGSLAGRQAFLLQRMTGLEDGIGALVLRRLEPQDYVTLVEVMQVFMQRGRKTGR